MMKLGRIKFYNKNKGFGFIEEETGQGDIFFYYKEFKSELPIREGERVEYKEGTNERGNCAKEIKRVMEG